jgi:hypothetical protein
MGNFMSIHCSLHFRGDVEDFVVSFFENAARLKSRLLLIDDIDLLTSSSNDDYPSSVLINCLGKLDRNKCSVVATCTNLSGVNASLLVPGKLDKVIRFPYPSPKLRSEFFMKAFLSTDIFEIIRTEKHSPQFKWEPNHFVEFSSDEKTCINTAEVGARSEIIIGTTNPPQLTSKALIAEWLARELALRTQVSLSVCFQ